MAKKTKKYNPIFKVGGKRVYTKVFELTQEMINAVCAIEFYDGPDDKCGREVDIRAAVSDLDYYSENNIHDGVYENDDLVDALNIIVKLRTFSTGFYVFHHRTGWSKVTPEQEKQISRLKFLKDNINEASKEKFSLETDLGV